MIMPAVKMSSTEVKAKMVPLLEAFERARQRVMVAERRGRKIFQKMEALQAQCPHENSVPNFESDVAEMKSRRRCGDCGAPLF
jgi:hypothetical protein